MKLFMTMTGAAVLLAAGAAQAGDVVVQLSGVQARGGQLLSTLQTRDQFMKNMGAYNLKQDAAAGSVTLTFKDVAPGEYAFSALHDEDGDRKMKANGQMPVEGWAMSKGETLMGPPAFDLVKITVPAEGLKLSTRMFYFDGQVPHAAASR